VREENGRRGTVRDTALITIRPGRAEEGLSETFDALRIPRLCLLALIVKVGWW
jgi:hypothetical protein